MAKKIIWIAVCVVSLSLGDFVWAQGGDSKTSGALGAPRQQVATIIFAGLAGAVLGLSTLSFYGRPQDRLSNIGVGAAVGVIAGAVYTTYKAASKPYHPEGEDLGAFTSPHELMAPVVPLAQYEWTF